MENKDLKILARKLAHRGKKYKEIKSELIQKTYDSKNVVKIMLDVYIYENEFALGLDEKEKVLHKLIIRVVVLTLGLIVTIYSFVSSKDQFILAYGAIIGGAFSIWKFYTLYKNPIEYFIPRTPIFVSNKFRKY